MSLIYQIAGIWLEHSAHKRALKQIHECCCSGCRARTGPSGSLALGGPGPHPPQPSATPAAAFVSHQFSSSQLHLSISHQETTGNAARLANRMCSSLVEGVEKIHQEQRSVSWGTSCFWAASVFTSFHPSTWSSRQTSPIKLHFSSSYVAQKERGFLKEGMWTLQTRTDCHTENGSACGFVTQDLPFDM